MELLIDEKWVERSRVVLERKLGRKLRDDEVAHHINEDTTDDRPENLQAMTNSEHSSYHAKKENAHLRFGSQDLENNPFYGKHHSEASKRKMSLNHPDVSGENNPAWKGDEASDHAKYMRSWRRKRKAKGFVRPHRIIRGVEGVV